jgi:hypothetical protein
VELIDAAQAGGAGGPAPVAKPLIAPSADSIQSPK